MRTNSARAFVIQTLEITTRLMTSPRNTPRFGHSATNETFARLKSSLAVRPVVSRAFAGTSTQEHLTDHKTVTRTAGKFWKMMAFALPQHSTPKGIRIPKISLQVDDQNHMNSPTPAPDKSTHLSIHNKPSQRRLGKPIKPTYWGQEFTESESRTTFTHESSALRRR